MYTDQYRKRQQLIIPAIAKTRFFELDVFLSRSILIDTEINIACAEDSRMWKVTIACVEDRRVWTCHHVWKLCVDQLVCSSWRSGDAAPFYRLSQVLGNQTYNTCYGKLPYGTTRDIKSYDMNTRSTASDNVTVLSSAFRC
jgi:hypothetical protein